MPRSMTDKNKNCNFITRSNSLREYIESESVDKKFHYACMYRFSKRLQASFSLLHGKPFHDITIEISSWIKQITHLNNKTYICMYV